MAEKFTHEFRKYWTLRRVMKHKFIRHGEVLVPATKYDLEYLSEFKNGEALNTELKCAKPRSLKFHKLYWSLINLSLDYWSPKAVLFPRRNENLQ